MSPFQDMVHRATFLLARDPSRSFGERIGLRLASTRGVEEAVVPIYWLRTGIWMGSRTANTLSPLASIGKRPTLFVAGAEDQICPPENAQKMYRATRSPTKALLIIPGADHTSTFSSHPALCESTVISFLQRVSR